MPKDKKKRKLFDLPPKKMAKEDAKNVKTIEKVLKEIPAKGGLIEAKLDDGSTEMIRDPKAPPPTSAQITGLTPERPASSMSGLSSGRIVCYVGEDGETRPGLIIRVMDEKENLVNLFIFLDRTPADASEKSIRHLVPYSAKHDALGYAPGSWHWPERT